MSGIGLAVKGAASALAIMVVLAVSPAGAQSVPQSLAADFEVRIQRLERDLSEVNGKYEEAQNEISVLKDRLTKMADDLDYRLGALEKGGAGRSGSTTARPAAPPPEDNHGAGKNTRDTAPSAGNLGSTARSAPIEPTPADPQKAYEQAFGYLREANYDKAEKAFQDFLGKHANNTLAGNAQYWLGETYYVRGKYVEAAQAFATAMKNYPKSNKAPDNLLKLGMALSSLNKKNEACSAFGQLPRLYPESSAALKKRAEGERRKLNCPG